MLAIQGTSLEAQPLPFSLGSIHENVLRYGRIALDWMKKHPYHCGVAAGACFVAGNALSPYFYLPATALSVFPIRKVLCGEWEDEKIDVDTLLKQKLVNPSFVLTPEQSIAIISAGIEQGEREAEKVRNQEVIFCIGSTGSGKSTFINRLYGCQMESIESHVVGINKENSFSETVVVVKSRAKGGSFDEVMPIGHHQKLSMTFMPQIEKAPDGKLYGDFPGIFDNRGFEVETITLAAIKNMFQKAGCLKIVLLVDYNSLRGSKGNGARAMIEIFTKLFGSEEIRKYRDSILFGITKIPRKVAGSTSETIEDLRSLVAKKLEEDHKFLAERLFIYDPEDQPLKYNDAWSREDILRRLDNLLPIRLPATIFKMVLTPKVMDELEKLFDILRKKIEIIFNKGTLSERDLKAVRQYRETLQHLRIIGHPHITNLQQPITEMIEKRYKDKIDEFLRHYSDTDYDNTYKLKELRSLIEKGCSYFFEIGCIPGYGELERQIEEYQGKIEAKNFVAKLERMQDRFYEHCQNCSIQDAKRTKDIIYEKLDDFNQHLRDRGFEPRIDRDKMESAFQIAQQNHAKKQERLEAERRERERLEEQRQENLRQAQRQERMRIVGEAVRDVTSLQELQSDFNSNLEIRDFDEARRLLNRIENDSKAAQVKCRLHSDITPRGLFVDISSLQSLLFAAEDKVAQETKQRKADEKARQEARDSEIAQAQSDAEDADLAAWRRTGDRGKADKVRESQRERERKEAEAEKAAKIIQASAKEIEALCESTQFRRAEARLQNLQDAMKAFEEYHRQYYGKRPLGVTLSELAKLMY